MNITNNECYSASTIKLHHEMLALYGEMEIRVIRVLNCCLVRLDQGEVVHKGGDSEERERFKPVDVRRYAELSDIGPGQAHKEIIEVLEVLRATPLRFKLSNGAMLTTSLVHRYIAQEEERIVLIDIDTALVGYLSGTLEKGKFLQANSAMDGVKSAKRYNFYLLVQKNLWKLRSQACFILTEDEIREVFKLDSGQYKEKSRIAEKLIKPALAEVYKKLGVKLKVSSRITGFEISEDKGRYYE